MYKKVRFLANVVILITIISIVGVWVTNDSSVTISGTQENRAIYSGDENTNSVSLTFNVYENTEIVKGIVNVLKEKGVSATFFVGGCWADDNKETLKLIVDSGFELGNHGYFHKDHKKLSESYNLQEIQNCQNIVYSLIGYKMNLFAPPSGSYSQTTLKVAKELGLKVIMWSKDTIDWRDSDENLIFTRATNLVKSGDLILMHPKAHTLNALPKIIDEIKKKGLDITTVSKCCNLSYEL